MLCLFLQKFNQSSSPALDSPSTRFAMGFIKNCLLVKAVVLVVLTAYLYNPLPTGVNEPWKVQSVMMLSGAGTLIVSSRKCLFNS